MPFLTADCRRGTSGGRAAAEAGRLEFVDRELYLRFAARHEWTTRDDRLVEDRTAVQDETGRDVCRKVDGAVRCLYGEPNHGPGGVRCPRSDPDRTAEHIEE